MSTLINNKFLLAVLGILAVVATVSTTRSLKQAITEPTQPEQVVESADESVTIRKVDIPSHRPWTPDAQAQARARRTDDPDEKPYKVAGFTAENENLRAQQMAALRADAATLTDDEDQSLTTEDVAAMEANRAMAW